MKRYFNFIIIVCAIVFGSDLFAQKANISLTMYVTKTAHSEYGTTGGDCWETGTEDYTGKIWFWTEADGTWRGGTCRTCDNNGDCTNGSWTDGYTYSNTPAEVMDAYLDAWEDDGDRCNYGSGDDCRTTDYVSSTGANRYFREVSYPSNGSYMYYGGNQHDFGDDDNWGQVGLTWKYTGSSSAISMTCNAQTATQYSGRIRSQSVYLNAGSIYRFQTTSGPDTYLRLYGPDGYSIVAADDDGGGSLLSKITYTASSTGWYYIETAMYLSGTNRNPLNANTVLEYQLVPPVLGSPSTTQVNFCDSGGNFITAVTANSTQYGTVEWNWGRNNGTWSGLWTTGTSSGVCCFPKKTSNSDGNADRIRYRVNNGGCYSAYSPTILITNNWNEAPTSMSVNNASYCSTSVPSTITLTATFPSNINMNGTVKFYSGSCGGVLVGTVNPGELSSTASLTISAPSASTTYYARYESSCETTSCASISVYVPVVSLTANVTQPTCFGSTNGAIDLDVNVTVPNFGNSLRLWTKANEGIEINASNDVTKWNDLSGYNNHFTTTYGSNTKIQESSINGKPAIRFNNASVMETPSFATNPYTMIVVGKMNSGTNARLVSSGTTNWLMGWWGGYRDRMYADGWVNSGPNTNILDPYIYSVSGSGSLTSFYRNGSLVASNASGVSAPGIISLGGWGTGNTELSNGDVAEVIVYNKVLTNEERQIVERYLASKYAISGPSPLYTYAWSPGGASTEDRTGLSNGTYSVTVTTESCPTTLPGIAVTQPSDIAITATTVNEGCPSDDDGSIDVTLTGGITNIRYIKITQRRPATESWLNINEIQAYEIFTGTNVALGKTATTNNPHGSYPASRLTDGIINNGSGMFHTGTPAYKGDWARVDLGAAYHLDYIRIQNRTDCCQYRADDLLLEFFDASNSLIYSSKINASANTYTHNVLDAAWSDGGTTLDRTDLDGGTYSLTITDVNGCTKTQGYTLTTKTLSTAPIGATASSSFFCSGDAVTLTAVGGSLGTGATWKWYSDAGFTTSVGSGSPLTVYPTGNTTFYVRAEGDCNNTLDRSVAVIVNGSSTAPSSTVSLASNSSTSTCVVNDNNWHYFYNNFGELLAAVNSNGQNLGNVTVSITVGDSGPFLTSIQGEQCFNSGANQGEYAMPRYWDITTTNAPSSVVDVIFYYKNSDVASLVATVNSRDADYLWCWGDVNGESDLMMTVRHSGGSTEIFTSLAFANGPNTIDGQRQIAFQLSEFSGGKLHSNGGRYGANPLPVELINFTAEAINNKKIQLNWTTASEINNKGFEIERSLDGINFETIGWVDGNGNSNEIHTYETIDSEVSVSVGTYYYRLKQIDFDDAFEYSDVASATITSLNVFEASNFIPNPSSHATKLDFELPNNTEVQIELFDNLGRLVTTKVVHLSAGKQSIEFNTTDYSAGVYFANIYMNSHVFSRKLVVEK
ncbi:MAG: T9SS type A sorting domain-containing protein [Chitinophagales bacterium]